MRRYWVLALALLTLLGMMGPPPASAAETKVTIGGLVDNVTNVNVNMNLNSSERARGGITTDDDDEWYSRTRARWFISAAKGKAKVVLGLEIDCIYGQTANADNQTEARILGGGRRQDGTRCAADADTDVVNAIELKHQYVEFPVTGEGSLLPFVPYAGMARVGLQPYKVTYKPFVSHGGSDFAGLNLEMTFSPQVKGQVVVVQFEEEATGPLNGFNRGDDIGLIFATAITPWKGLDIKPIFSWQELKGATSGGNVRTSVGGVGVGGAAIPNDSFIENRFLVGFDARWRSGPWSLKPTFFYNFGDRDRRNCADSACTVADNPRRPLGAVSEADIRAWFLDIEGGWRVGPLSIEVRGMITSGNDAKDDLDDEINYFQMFHSGNAYWIGWGEASGIGLIDYLTSLNGFINAVSLPFQASFDRYGRVMGAVRVRYNLTPALRIYGIVNPAWTLEDVDTRGTLGGFTGITPSSNPGAADENYLGVDITTGFTWRFAPGLSFDWVGGIFLPGDAMDICVTAGCSDPEEADPALVSTARVRYVF